MKTIYLPVILIIFIRVEPIHSSNGKGTNFRCDYTYFKEADGFLKFHEIPAKWHEARLRCHLEGAKLASPLNSGLKSSMQKTLAKHCSDCSIFTGIHATFSRGDYFSVEGIPLNKIPHTWSSGEPDAYGNRESCMIQLPDNAKLADVKCSSTFPYICYKKMSKSLVLNNCGTSDNGYTLNAKTRSCYKFHRVPRTWSRAYMTCAAEGGYLVILNSETEVAAVKDIFAKNPASTMIGNFEKYVALVGFNDWNEHGEWLTINGDTLQEAGYYKFSPGQPDNATGGEYCGSIFRTGLLNDIWCEKKFPFICEMIPNSIPCI